MTRLWPALLSLVTVIGLGVGSHLLYADYSRAQAQVEYLVVPVLRAVDGEGLP